MPKFAVETLGQSGPLRGSSKSISLLREETPFILEPRLLSREGYLFYYIKRRGRQNGCRFLQFWTLLLTAFLPICLAAISNPISLEYGTTISVQPVAPQPGASIQSSWIYIVAASGLENGLFCFSHLSHFPPFFRSIVVSSSFTLAVELSL